MRIVIRIAIAMSVVRARKFPLQVGGFSEKIENARRASIVIQISLPSDAGLSAGNLVGPKRNRNSTSTPSDRKEPRYSTRERLALTVSGTLSQIGSRVKSETPMSLGSFLRATRGSEGRATDPPDSTNPILCRTGNYGFCLPCNFAPARIPRPMPRMPSAIAYSPMYFR
jgi:hypothetical protein